MSQKPLPKPAWIKNTYFWITAVLFVLAIVSLVTGRPDVIRDPGQKREGGLAFVYLLAAVVMLVNGFVSHRQTVRTFDEQVEETEASSFVPSEPIGSATEEVKEEKI